MGEPSLSASPSLPDEPGQHRLDSWKDIAVYLKRDISTVQRWERREGMPVHRHVHERRGSVYAFRTELDQWMASRHLAVEANPAEPVAVPDVPAAGVTRGSPLVGRFALAAVAILVVAAAVAYLAYTQRTAAEPSIRSLAVLPLENLSGDPAQEYFADGMTESLIGSLSTIRGLRVISRTSAMQFKGKRQSLPQIARTLGVDAVVEGSIVRSENRVRIHAQLLRAATDEHVWSASYDREMRDLLALQSEVAHAIARRIEITVTEQGQRAALLRPVAPHVYDTYLKGRFALNSGTRGGIKESIGYFEAVTAEDPTFAPAYSGLAAAHCDLTTVFFGVPPAEGQPKAMAALRKALELDPNLVEAHTLRADLLQKQWQWKEAEAGYRRALALNPNYAAAHVGLAHWLAYRGRAEEALAAAQVGRGLDPLALYGIDIGWILYQSRRYGDAIRELRNVLAVRPDEPFAVWYLGFALLADGQTEESIRVLERTASLTDRSAGALGVLARAYGSAGRRDDTLRILRELELRQHTSYVPAAAFVNTYLGLADRERTFLWLERAYREKSNMLQLLKVHPAFDPLREDARFADLLRRVQLTD